MKDYIAKVGDNIYKLYKILEPGQLIILNNKLRVSQNGDIVSR